LADASQSASADTAPADAALSGTSNIIYHHCTRKEASLLKKSPGHGGRDFNALLHREQHETSYSEWEPIDRPSSEASALQIGTAEPMVLGLASKEASLYARFVTVEQDSIEHSGSSVASWIMMHE